MNFESVAFLVQGKKFKIDFQDGRHGRHLGFPITFELFFFFFLIYKSPRCSLPSFESIGLSVQEKKRKIDFQDGRHLGFPIGTILAIFNLQVIPMLPTSFRLSWPFGSGKEAKKREFQDGRHSGDFGFPIETILAIFDLQVAPMLPTMFRVKWPFGSGEEAKNRFSRWPPSWISDRNDFSYF